MTGESLHAFRDDVLHDAPLQRRLLEVTDDVEFVALVVSMAWERGYNLQSDKMEDAMRARHRTWVERWLG